MLGLTSLETRHLDALVSVDSHISSAASIRNLESSRRELPDAKCFEHERLARQQVNRNGLPTPDLLLFRRALSNGQK